MEAGPDQQRSCGEGNSNQEFKLVASGSYYTIQHPASGKCIDVNGLQTGNGTKIHLWSCNTGNANQNFALKRY